MLFIVVLSEVWLIPGLWELESGYVTLKNEGWVTFGWNQIESTLGRGHVRILPHSSLCIPEARLPTLCFSSPKPTHNSSNTPVLLTYSPASTYASVDHQLLTALHVGLCPRGEGLSQGKDVICSLQEPRDIFQSEPPGSLPLCCLKARGGQ